MGAQQETPSHQHADHHCWRCGHEAEAAQAKPMDLFCTFCNSVQAPVPDYFRFFGMPVSLSVDPAKLQEKFYSLSRLLHPDKFTRSTDRERIYSLEGTAILNDGFRVLRDPVQRAEYVLKNNGFPIGEQRSQDVPPELLEEVFELNMALDELRAGDDDARPQLQEARDRFQAMLGEIDAELETQFLSHDAAADAEARLEVLKQIRTILNRRRYVRNLVQEVDKELVARP